MDRRCHCSAHCRACGRCFSSVSAFDRHRTGPPADRHCCEPADVETKDGRPVFAVKDMAGICDLAGDTRIAVVWALARSQHHQARLDALRAA